MDIIACGYPAAAVRNGIYLIQCNPCSSTTLANSSFPGPIIRANKVGFSGANWWSLLFSLYSHTLQGDELKIEVSNLLDDNSLDLATSIVRSLIFWMNLEHQCAPIALAWPLPRSHQLRRWSFICHPVSPYTQRKLFI